LWNGHDFSSLVDLISDGHSVALTQPSLVFVSAATIKGLIFVGPLPGTAFLQLQVDCQTAIAHYGILMREWCFTL